MRAGVDKPGAVPPGFLQDLSRPFDCVAQRLVSGSASCYGPLTKAISTKGGLRAMTMRASRPTCRTDEFAAAGVSIFASLRTAAGRLAATLPVWRSLFTPPPETSEDLSGRNGYSPANRRAGRGFARRFAAAGSVLLLGAVFLIAGTQAAGAGTLTFYFYDDGENSTIVSRGTLDLSGLDVIPGDRNAGATTLFQLAYRISQNQAFPHSTGGFTKDRYVIGPFTVSGRDSFGGTQTRFNLADYSYMSDLYMEFFRRNEGDQLHVNPDDVSGDTYDPSARSITFNGTLTEVFNDDDFHVEYAFGSQKVVFKTGRPPPLPPESPTKAAEKQALKHTLAAVAQTTLAGAAETIGQRFDAAPGTQSLTLAGQRVGGAIALPAAEGNRWDRIDRWDGRTAARSEAVSGSALLGGSAFTLPLAAAGSEGASGGPAWTVWGRGDWRAFEGGRSGDAWDGEQSTGWLGVDGRLNEGLTAGVALSHGEGETDYRPGASEGRLETSLTALWPYLQMKTAGGGGAVRVMLGAGTGEAEHRASAGTVEKADLSLLAGAVSGRMPVARRSAFTLSAIGGASLAQIETDGSSSTSSLGGLQATSWRLNAGMEAEHDGFALSSGSDWQARPRGAVALRQDGGDGVTGTGMDVSGGVRLSAPGSRFGLDASGHWLALHSEDDTRERGASLEARLAPGADGRGLSLALGPAWGQQQVGALARERLFDEAQGDNDTPQRLSLIARTGYGFAAAGGLLTPFADMALGGESRTQHYRTGIGFARGGIDAALTAGHRAGGEPDTRIGMDLRLNF